MIKVCGMREADNIRAVETLGVDLMGFIFYPPSPRYVRDVPAYMPRLCRRVGVFVDADDDFIQQHIETFGLDILQLHGHEEPSRLHDLKTKFDLPIIKAHSIEHEADAAAASQYDAAADLFIFDTRCTTMGGSGRQFDWSVLQAYEGQTPFLLSGGIGPDDACKIKTFSHPRCVGVDLNSRFETAPALKNTTLIEQFILQL